MLTLEEHNMFGTDGSGNQKKAWIGNYLYKVDSKFRDSTKEISASRLADAFGLEHVAYYPSECILDGKVVKCVKCASFLEEDENDISIAALIKLIDLPVTDNTSAKDFFGIVVKTINDVTGISVYDIEDWLLKILTFDYLICNDDRHLRNLSVICNNVTGEYRLAPMYDNGHSFLRLDGCSSKEKFIQLMHKYKSKPFSTNPEKNIISITDAQSNVYLWEKNMQINSITLNDLDINSFHRTIVKYRIEKLMSL